MFSQSTFVALHNINICSTLHVVTGAFSQFQSDLHMPAVAYSLQSTHNCDHHNITEMQQGTNMHSVHIHIKLDCCCHCEGHTGTWVAVYCCGLDQSVVQVLLKISCFHRFGYFFGCPVVKDCVCRFSRKFYILNYSTLVNQVAVIWL